MSDPWWVPDIDKISFCCGAFSSTEIDIDNTGRCSKCKEMSLFVPANPYNRQQPCDNNCANLTC